MKCPSFLENLNYTESVVGSNFGSLLLCADQRENITFSMLSAIRNPKVKIVCIDRLCILKILLQRAIKLSRFGYTCPQDYNIAEFLIDKVSLSDFDAEERVRVLCEHYSASTMKDELHGQIKFTRQNNLTSGSRLEKNSKVTNKFNIKKIQVCLP